MFQLINKILNKDIEGADMKVVSGLLGVCIGDALGVPVEYTDRQTRVKDPVKGMRSQGGHGQHSGTWSDDSSLTFCTAESLCHGFEIKDIGEKFCSWYYDGLWTPDDQLTFSVGRSTSKAVANIRMGINPEEAGAVKDINNGNGSLMRILPLAYYLKDYEGDKFDVVERVSAITHAHIRSKIACSIYIEVAMNLLKGYDPFTAYEEMKPVIIQYYNQKGFSKELEIFNRVLVGNISSLSVDDINSGGYVVDTLESSLWCFLRSTNFKTAVLSAVNLGDDTDTTGAVTGGLAGIYYGYNKIPKRWLNRIAKKDEIINLCIDFSKSLESNINKKLRR